MHILWHTCTHAHAHAHCDACTCVYAHASYMRRSRSSIPLHPSNPSNPSTIYSGDPRSNGAARPRDGTRLTSTTYTCTRAHMHMHTCTCTHAHARIYVLTLGARRPDSLPPHLPWVRPRLRRHLLRPARGDRDGRAARLRHTPTAAALHGIGTE